MSSIGPAIPAHLLRKTSTEEEGNVPINPLHNGSAGEEDEDDDDSFVPELPPDLATSKPSASVIGPTLPAHFSRPQDDGTDSDEDYGPSPLPPGVQLDEEGSGVREFIEREQRRMKEVEEAAKPKAAKREEWMLVPPKASDLLSTLDPTKLRARQFSTATPTPSTSRDGPNLWTETPAEKQARLADEVSGRKRRAADASETPEEIEEARKKRRRDREIQREIEEHNRSSRSKTLLEQHASSKPSKNKDSDKAPGIWDRERDMSVTGRLLDDSARKKLIKDSKGLGDRFGHGKSGGYL